MNKLQYLTLFIAMAFDLTLTASAAEQDVQTQIWDHYANKVDVAVILAHSFENSHSRSTLNVVVKNASDQVINYFAVGKDSGLKIFYKDKNGNEVALHDYHIDGNHVLQPKSLAPGESRTIIVNLKHDELTLLESLPVSYQFVIYYPASKQSETIRSQSKILQQQH